MTDKKEIKRKEEKKNESVSDCRTFFLRTFFFGLTYLEIALDILKNQQ